MGDGIGPVERRSEKPEGRRIDAVPDHQQKRAARMSSATFTGDPEGPLALVCQRDANASAAAIQSGAFSLL